MSDPLERYLRPGPDQEWILDAIVEHSHEKHGAEFRPVPLTRTEFREVAKIMVSSQQSARNQMVECCESRMLPARQLARKGC